jgi:predicted exporter
VRESALVRRLRALENGGALAGHQAVSDYVPPLAQQQADRALLGERVFADAGALRRTMAEVGYAPEAADALAEEFRRAPGFVGVRDWLASPLSVPYRHLWEPAGAATPASVVTLQGESDPVRVAQAQAGLDGVALVDKAGSASALLGTFRAWSIPALLVAAAAMLAVLALRYGWRDAPRLMIPVALGEAISVAVFGYSGEPVTLFAVAGWLLSLGIGINYAIFLREGSQRPGATTLAVLLSGSTTLLGFGLLSLSGVPALHQFGLALLATIATAALLAPLALDRSA